MFSEILEQRLRSSGWSPERQISIQEWVDQLKSEGFSFHSRAIEILRNFGELKIKPCVEMEKYIYGPEPIVFNPGLAEYDRIEEWEERLGMSLSPLAEVGSQMIVYIAEDGRVFGNWCDELHFIAESFEEALESLIVKNELPQIYGCLDDELNDDNENKSIIIE